MAVRVRHTRTGRSTAVRLCSLRLHALALGFLFHLLGDLQGTCMEVKLTDLLKMIPKNRTEEGENNQRRTWRFHALVFPNTLWHLGLKTRARAPRGSKAFGCFKSSLCSFGTANPGWRHPRHRHPDFPSYLCRGFIPQCVRAAGRRQLRLDHPFPQRKFWQELSSLA